MRAAAGAKGENNAAAAALSSAAAIRLGGSLTIEDVDEWHEQFVDRLCKGAPLHIDASEVDAVDTAGLQLIAAVFKTAQQKGVDVALTAASSGFAAAAKRVGLDTLFDINSDKVRDR